MPAEKPAWYQGATPDVRADVLDFRDNLYRPTLIEVPVDLTVEEFKKGEVPILDQGRNKGCTGFALATCANYLLRRRRVTPDPTPVSPAMLYALARKYDEYPGEDDSRGSSLRGAMKGWHKHGVCSEEKWPWDPARLYEALDGERGADARRRPLGAYQRVNHKDLTAMHSALAEVGILVASAQIPMSGWYYATDGSGGIPRADRQNPFMAPWGGHAFVVVGYDSAGFWIQNSWGRGWGLGGFGHLEYGDWLEYGMDAWVARLGVPIHLDRPPPERAPGRRRRTLHEVRPHFVGLDDYGQLQSRGPYSTSPEDVRVLVEEELPRITAGWPGRRILLIAGGGLRRPAQTIEQLAELRPHLLAQHIYPLVLLWQSSHYPRIVEILHRAAEQQRPEGADVGAFGFMLDRRDDALEGLARRLGGKAEWDRMKLAALDSTIDEEGGVRTLLQRLAVQLADPRSELHLVGHSAGAVLLAPLVQLVTGDGARRFDGGPMKDQLGLGLRIASCSLLAPACTVDLFREAYLPALTAGRLERLCLFTLTDEAERDDDCDDEYGRSLLYLAANAFEQRPRVPGGQGVPLLGLAHCVEEQRDLVELFTPGAPVAGGFPRTEWIKAPNREPAPRGSAAHHHQDFSSDAATRSSVLARVLNLATADTLVWLV